MTDPEDDYSWVSHDMMTALLCRVVDDLTTDEIVGLCYVTLSEEFNNEALSIARDEFPDEWNEHRDEQIAKLEAALHERWRLDRLPGVAQKYEQDGVPDIPARSEDFSNWLDGLVRDGEFPDEYAAEVGQPECNFAPWELA